MPLKMNQIALIVLSSIAAYMFWQTYQNIYGNKGRLSIYQEADAIVLSWHTEIDIPMVKRFEEAFSKWRDKTDTFIIDLNSPGGALLEGRLVIELINDMKHTHQIKTRVGPDNYCLSMCVPIYLQGENRIAAASSKWMFHEPYSTDFFTGEDADIPEYERQATSERYFNRYFINSEINTTWRENLAREWVGKDVWRTGRQLVDENSNIILKLY